VHRGLFRSHGLPEVASNNQPDMHLMIPLVSPEFDFYEFCQCMVGKNLLQVMEAASAEAARAHRAHRQKTKRDFRRGSRGSAYCDDLQRLVSLLMGTVPEDISDEFLQSPSGDFINDCIASVT
jgi:hypothetical protein